MDKCIKENNELNCCVSEAKLDPQERIRNLNWRINDLKKDLKKEENEANNARLKVIVLTELLSDNNHELRQLHRDYEYSQTERLRRGDALYKVKETCRELLSDNNSKRWSAKKLAEVILDNLSEV